MNSFMNSTTCNIVRILIKGGIVFAVLKVRKLDFLVLGHLLGMDSN